LFSKLKVKDGLSRMTTMIWGIRNMLIHLRHSSLQQGPGMYNQNRTHPLPVVPPSSQGNHANKGNAAEAIRK
jgi:hypothetical protein